MTDTTPVPFTLLELWVLQSFIRHEQPQPWQGKWPGYSLELNDDIAAAIVFCVDEEQEFAQLMLSRGDCLVIDCCVNNAAKDSQGNPAGKMILLKSFRARQALSYPMSLTDEPDRDEQASRMETFRKATE